MIDGRWRYLHEGDEMDIRHEPFGPGTAKKYKLKITIKGLKLVAA